MLIDCGHNGTTQWRPSTWLASNGLPITNLTITNFDEDHLTDLPNVYRVAPPQSLSKNWNLDSRWVCQAKRENGMGDGVRAACAMIDRYTGPALSSSWGGASIQRFCHGLSDFDDENSLSLVTFVQYNGVRIVFPGDLTAEAWNKFLQNVEFCRWLRSTNIFIASHHGREDGYAPEVFNICRPSIIIASDKSVMYETQIVDYSQHASGILWNQTGVRKFLTTRHDGTMTIVPNGTDGFHITASR